MYMPVLAPCPPLVHPAFDLHPPPACPTPALRRSRICNNTFMGAHCPRGRARPTQASMRHSIKQRGLLRLIPINLDHLNTVYHNIQRNSFFKQCLSYQTTSGDLQTVCGGRSCQMRYATDKSNKTSSTACLLSTVINAVYHYTMPVRLFLCYDVSDRLTDVVHSDGCH
jgi:hypothetical protein